MRTAEPRGVFCGSCNYDLLGVASPGKCPECGRTFDASDPRRFVTIPRHWWRTWVRRALITTGVLALVLVLAPSRVARFTWSWPNGDGTVTIRKRWRLVGPEWLPLRYPGWTASTTTEPAPAQLTVAEFYVWRVRLSSLKLETGRQTRNPAGQNPRQYGALLNDPIHECATIAPSTLDTLENWLLYSKNGTLVWCPRVLKPGEKPGIDKSPPLEELP